ncbi:MAG: ATP-binding protein [Candidatus Nitricoxidivorans perseverans]|uniref:histidine kinase n=1 Tax=Candidatus Nitricoxidivorans perseverans TaxID=2975601 RepID=A0AA49FKP3_9PROT|nr:MAG: ATP-binding protein [Candidatus Nitricoxidivorans perseverans]
MEQNEEIARLTRQLAEANARIEREQREMTELLGKVEEAQGQVLQSEKMAAIGQLAAGVAHEINNPVGFVNSNLGTLKGYVDKLLKLLDAYERHAGPAADEVPEVAEARREADIGYLRQDIVDLLRESEEGLVRVKKIVQDLKEFSHVNDVTCQQTDLNAGMESTLNVVRNELKYKAEVRKEYGDLPPVTCVAAQINQVFMNLLVNAAQAIPEHGTITVRSGIEGTGEWVWFEVADTGKGMPSEVKARIFEPFFTTKPVGKGTGLGLSLSYDIVVKKHGGRIEVESEPGKGTTFRVWLPVAGPAADES